MARFRGLGRAGASRPVGVMRGASVDEPLTPGMFVAHEAPSSRAGSIDDGLGVMHRASGCEVGLLQPVMHRASPAVVRPPRGHDARCIMLERRSIRAGKRLFTARPR